MGNGGAHRAAAGPAHATSEAELQRGYWRLAAVLFIGGGLGAVPTDALHRPPYDPAISGCCGPMRFSSAIVSGIFCWIAADRLASRWLHVMTVAATLEIALTAWLADEIFAIYYVFIAIYAAYAFRDRRAIALHVGFASFAAMAPLLYDSDNGREALILAFVLIPTLAIAAGVVAFLRERLEASERRFRQLAERDPLTGVGNYRLLSERLPVEI